LFEASLVVEEEPTVTVATVAPTLPLIEKVGVEHVAVKFAVTLAEVIVTELEAGEKVQPDLLGVTV
jgi:hypothetical protein